MWVVDASVVAKSVLAEEGSQAAAEWVEARQRALEPMSAPAILWTEVGRAIQKGTRGLDAVAKHALLEHALFGIGLEHVDAEASAVWKACDAAGLTFPDAQYVHLARRQKATLVSADREQLRAAAKLGVKGLHME